MVEGGIWWRGAYGGAKIHCVNWLKLGRQNNFQGRAKFPISTPLHEDS